jgi:hypothetical protein
MFRLTNEAAAALSGSQIVILKRGQNIKYLPYVFTENGVTMLSSVPNSERAIQQMRIILNENILYLSQ